MSNILDIAQHYVRSGWSVIPIAYRQKRPTVDKWQELRIPEWDLPAYFNGAPQNIGVLLGDPSHDLVDIDIDCPEALELAPRMLPPTPLTFGRASKPRSHYLYRAKGATVERFVETSHLIDASGLKRKVVYTICELRSTGGQTVFPGSVHPSGEVIEWSEDVPDAPLGQLAAPLPLVNLRAAVARLAGAVLLVRAGVHGEDAMRMVAGAIDAIDGPIGAQIRSWLRLPVPRGSAVDKPTHGNPSGNLSSAVENFNRDHPHEFPRNSAECPICGASASFGRLPQSPDRWACHSTKHPDDVGIRGKDCTHGDALDLVAHERGKSRMQVLREDGYLVVPTAAKIAPVTDGSVKLEPLRIVTAENAFRQIWPTPLPPAFKTGIPDLDRLTGGLRVESVTALNGPPGRGKSGLALQIARAVAHEGRSAVYMTSELSTRQALARLSAQERGVPWLEVFDTGPSETEVHAASVAGLPIYVVELVRGMDFGATVSGICDALGHAPLLILDYLQHAARRINPNEPRFATALLSDALSNFSKDAHTAVLTVSGVARANYNPDDERHGIALQGAGKDAGEIEYDAAVDLLLLTDGSRARLEVTKNRFGAPGSIGLFFDGAIGTFTEDQTATLSELDWTIVRAIRSGADTYDAIVKAAERRKSICLAALRRLVSIGLIERAPFRVIENRFHHENDDDF